MKKKLPITLIVLVLVGCSSKDKDMPPEHEASSNVISRVEKSESDVKVIKFQSLNQKEFLLKTSDNFVTATLIDDKGKNYSLKEVPVASGMRLEGENGVAIHTKNGEGVIEFSKNNYFIVKQLNQ